MKSSMYLGGILLAGLAIDASAACPGARLTADQILGQLNDTSITAVSQDNTEEWKEDHCSGGNLFKVGTTESPPKYPDAPSVDPRVLTGNWSVGPMTGGGDGITYSYYIGGSQTVGPVSGPFRVYLANGTLYFCTTGDDEVARTTVRGALTDTCP